MKKILFLYILANIGTTLGLITTFAGVIYTYNGILNDNSREMSQGIALSVTATAFSLLVALTIMIRIAYAISKYKACKEVT